MSDRLLGLRERKKRQTRAHISRQATRLFLERGFDDVTIAEVAAAAEVAKMTVTNYFPRKEDLALDLGEAFVRGPACAVRGRRAGESALAGLRRALLDAIGAHDPVIGFSGREFARMVMASPALRARLREFHDERERALVSALAEETGATSRDLMPRVAGVQLGGLLRLLFEETLGRTLDGHRDDHIAAAVTELAEQAFGLLEPVLGAYAVRPATDGPEKPEQASGRDRTS